MSFFTRLNFYLSLIGFSPKSFLLSVKGIKQFLKNKSLIKKQIASSDKFFSINKLHPCLTDRYDTAGELSLHYFHQDLLIANKIFLNNPVKHVDVGSRIDGFVAQVASFREIKVLDIRKMKNEILNVEFHQADITDKNFNLINYCDSLSCLHALEHFGLGRYGDEVNINAHLSGLENLYKMLKENGKIYISVPIGPQRIEFDAHRVFSIKYLLDQFENKFRMDAFSYIDDNNNLFENVELEQKNVKSNFSCTYGCGIFEMTKIL